MKLALLPILFTLPALGLAAVPDACWFVSMRKIQKPSTCDEETNECSGLYQVILEDGTRKLSSSGTIRISCQQAGEEVGAIIARLLDHGGGGVVNVPALLDSGIIGTLQRVVIFGDGRTRVSDEVVESMRAIDQYFLKFISTVDDVSEYHKLRSEIRSSPEFRQFMNVLELYAVKTQNAPYKTKRDDVIVIRQFVLFAFDLLSVVQDGEETYVRDLQNILSLYPPVMPVSSFSSVGGSLELTRTISNLSPTSNERLNFEIVGSFLEDLEFNMSRDPAATEMTIAYIQSVICPDIVPTIFFIQWTSRTFRIGASLIALCAGVSTVRHLSAANELLNGYIQIDRPQLDVVTEEAYAAAAEALLRGDLSWKDRFPTLITAKFFFFRNILRILDPLVDEGRINRFKSVSEFDSRELFEDTMLALGRLCAVYILNDIKLGPLLSLPFEFYDAIRSPDSLDETQIFTLLRNDGIVEPADPVDQAVMSYVAEPAFLVRMGIKEVLGPAGIEMFTPAQWSAFFGRSPT
jgi:hypothetical protein